MVFGHQATSTNFSIRDNAFLSAGCVQTAGDRAGLAFMCPNGHKPTGHVTGNTFFNCKGVPAIYSNPAVAGCSDGVILSGNTIVNATPTAGNLDPQAAVAMPQLNIRPPSPGSTLPSVLVPITVDCATAGAVVRYTTDGSRPDASSPVVPPHGAVFAWPGPSFAFNVRAFDAAGKLVPSVTNGAVVERSTYRPRVGPGAGPDLPLVSSWDGLKLAAASSSSASSSSPSSSASPQVQVQVAGDGTAAAVAHITGWVVDPVLAGGGVPAVEVELVVGYSPQPLRRFLANVSRPDLVKAKVAPNPEHGIDVQVTLPAAGGRKQVVELWALVARPGDTERRVRLSGSPKCWCGAAPCAC
jgi:hypothetical protein